MISRHWLRNTMRNRFRRHISAAKWRSLFERRKLQTIEFVIATRQSESDFWAAAPLAQGLKALGNDPSITMSASFENLEGLPTIYNRAIATSRADIVVFIHDDIWIEDPDFLEKIRMAIRHFDIVGVAGTTRRLAQQPAWLFRAIENQQFIWDHGYLSGSVRHGQPGHSEASEYGPAPAPCELMDGLFLAATRRNLIRSGVFFDPAFKFHFYDMDFCRSAKRAGLSLGTWPIDMIHLSAGSFGAPAWQKGYATYLSKWKN